MGLEQTRRGADCGSDLQLDRWLAGDAHDPDLARHITDCTRCADRTEQLKRDRAAFDIPLALPRRRASLRWGVGMAALAATAALVIGLRSGAAPPDGTRTKGGDRIDIYVASDGHVRAAGPGETVAPGDALQLTYTTTTPRYFALLSIDGAGALNRYYPPQGPAVALPAAIDAALPVSIVLDDVLGPERLFGVFCDRVFTPGDLRARDGELAAPAQCHVERFDLHKRMPR